MTSVKPQETSTNLTSKKIGSFSQNHGIISDGNREESLLSNDARSSPTTDISDTDGSQKNISRSDSNVPDSTGADEKREDDVESVDSAESDIEGDSEENIRLVIAADF